MTLSYLVRLNEPGNERSAITETTQAGSLLQAITAIEGMIDRMGVPGEFRIVAPVLDAGGIHVATIELVVVASE